MEIKAFYDERTSTLTYVVYNKTTRDAVIIDPVLDYDVIGSKVWTESVEAVAAFVRKEELRLHFILETHAHADHLSGAQRLKEWFPRTKLAIGEGITQIQEVFRDVFGLPASFPTDGSQFDVLLKDGEITEAGALRFKAIATPGHTPACLTLQFEDAVFTGDVLFMPDQGTGRCDFPAGSATAMYRSVQEKLYRLPDSTRVFVGHDYQPGGREMRYETTIGEQKSNNIQLPAAKSEETFIAFRESRDAGLSSPKLLFQSLQVNVAAGELPSPEENEVRYLKIPINVFRPVESGEITLKTLS